MFCTRSCNIIECHSFMSEFLSQLKFRWFIKLWQYVIQRIRPNKIIEKRMEIEEMIFTYSYDWYKIDIKQSYESCGSIDSGWNHWRLIDETVWSSPCINREIYHVEKFDNSFHSIRLWINLISNKWNVRQSNVYTLSKSFIWQFLI